MIESHNKGTLLSIKVKPRSKKQAIRLSNDLVYYVYVKAPPTRGQANIEAVKLVAKTLNVSIDRVQIISGLRSVNKILLIEGLNPNAVQAALDQ